MEPIPQHFTTVIATRTFDIVGARGARHLEVEVGAPVRDVETVSGYDWRCPVRAVDGATEHVRSACGVDAVQALELALTYLVTGVAAACCDDGERLEHFGEPVPTAC